MRPILHSRNLEIEWINIYGKIIYLKATVDSNPLPLAAPGAQQREALDAKAIL